VGESDLSGNPTAEYVFFDGERVARKDFPGNMVAYYFSDHLNTASVITDSAGVIKAESDYYPWGGELQFVNNDSNDYKFTGKKRDTETGLDYFGARYYSNALGRWISADWSATPVPVPYADFHDPQSLNLYGFVGGNPASKADPDGHDGPGSYDQAMAMANSIGERMAADLNGGPQASLPEPHTPAQQLMHERLQQCTCPEPQKQDNKSQNNNNSLQQNTKADQAKANAAKGKASEERVLNDKGLTKNNEKVSGTEGKSIPDYNTDAKVGEIKDANKVSNTQQLRIQKEAAAANGKEHELVTGTNTKVTDNAARGTNVERRNDLGPKKP